MKNGILNINKPAGMTSHDVVYRVRKVLGVKRVGHTGTLDPMATGVLPVCVGTATRITEYLDLDFKVYRCTMLLGKITDTQDIWGEVIEEKSTDGIDEKAIKEAFSSFSGLIEQKPPMFSAVRVDGRRLYEYAREGKQVDVKTRKVFIRSLNIIKFDSSKKTVDFEVECSKGTYIRTICQDVGMALGCGAVMTSLERRASGIFRIENALELDKLCSMDSQEAEKLMYDADYPLVHFGKVIVDNKAARSFVDGRHLPLSSCEIEREAEFKEQPPQIEIRHEYRKAYNVYKRRSGGNIFLGVAFYNDRYKKLVADKVFVRGEDIESI